MGFRLKALPKLADTKTSNNQLTLLQVGEGGGHAGQLTLLQVGEGEIYGTWFMYGTRTAHVSYTHSMCTRTAHVSYTHSKCTVQYTVVMRYMSGILVLPYVCSAHSLRIQYMSGTTVVLV